VGLRNRSPALLVVAMIVLVGLALVTLNAIGQDRLGLALGVTAVLWALTWALVPLTDRRLRPAEYVVEEPSQTSPAQPPPLDVDSAKIVADLGARVFADEGDRTKALDTRTSTLIAFTGAAMLFAAGAITKPPENLTEPQRALFVAAASLVVAGFVVALLLLFLALRTRPYRQISYGEWARYSEMSKAPADVYAAWRAPTRT
jgi:hypothetical protein